MAQKLPRDRAILHSFYCTKYLNSHLLNLSFKVNQIICLEDSSICLYGEVIQLIQDRGTCWFRPICMTIDNPDLDSRVQSKQLVNLGSGSDLLLPISLFRAALDVEVVSLLSELNDAHNSTEFQASCRQNLNRFVRQVWENNQDKF